MTVAAPSRLPIYKWFPGVEGHGTVAVVVRLQIAFDCKDPVRLADFYAKALRYKLEDAPPGFATIEEWLAARGVPVGEWDDGRAIVDPQGTWPRIWFHKMNTPKPSKNRLHLDLYVGLPLRATLEQRKALVDPEVRRIVALGAKISEAVEDGDYYFVTCFDPEGNEFDVA